jgi:hypothetical protein
MIKLKELTKVLTSGLQAEMDAHGFEFKRGHFQKTDLSKNIKYVFSVGALRWSYGFEVTPYVQITFGEVEKILIDLGVVDKNYSVTIGNETGNIATSKDGSVIGTKEERFVISEDKDIEKVIRELKRVFRQIALPYYEKYNTLQILDKILNDIPLQVCVHAPFLPSKRMNGLVVAKLIKRSNYEELVSIYTEESKELVPDLMESFNKVKEYLSSL